MPLIVVNTDPKRIWGDDYQPEHDYSKDYLTFEALADCTFTFEYPDDIGTSDSPILTHISYSVDNGETWVTEEFEPETAKTVTTPLIKTGETVLWKADGCTYDWNDGDYGYFSSDDEYNVYGNIMSLIYEDDFADKDTLLEGHSFGNLFEANDIVSAENLVLPATTLTGACYSGMFLECMALTTGPTLSATTLTESCYSSMFATCGGLKSVKMLATDISARGCLNNWISSETTGTLIINKDYEGVRSALNVPATWTILNEDGAPHIFPRDYSEEYLTFECVDSGIPNTIGVFDFNIPLGNVSVTSVSYSLDNGQTWTTYTNEGDDINISLNLSAGDKILLKGNAKHYASVHFNLDSPEENYSNIHLLGSWSVYGNIMSLFYGDNFAGKTSFPGSNTTYNCAGLFYHNDECNMGDLSNLILPATTLTENCYYAMFADCVGAITKAPVLPAVTLKAYCYSIMFSGCSTLNYVKAMFTTTPGINYTSNWLQHVASTGTFIKNKDATWTTTGTEGVPTGWTVETA